MCSCSFCSKNNPQKPVVRIKGASSYRREKKLAELAAVISGVSYPSISYAGTKTKTKSASSSSFANYSKVNSPLALEKEKKFKLKELGRMIKGR
jgi:hypothetical protein